MFHVLSSMLAIAVGFVTWSLAITLLKSGAGPVGGADIATLAVFFAPIVFVVAPAVLRQFDRDLIHLAAWIAAFAPFVGVLNIALVIFVAVAIGVPGDTMKWLIKGLAIIAWLIPGIPMWKSALIHDEE